MCEKQKYPWKMTEKELDRLQMNRLSLLCSFFLSRIDDDEILNFRYSISEVKGNEFTIKMEINVKGK